MLEIVEQDGYYKVKAIKEAMAQKYDEEQKWLRNEWTGRALKRLGFTEKHRVGAGVEYYLRRKEVEDLASRIGVKLHQKSQTQQKEQAEQVNSQMTKACWICGRPIIEVFEEWAFDASTGKPCHVKCLRKVTES